MQAAAAGIPPEVEMNPVLIKPEADTQAQVVLLGRPWKSFSARDYDTRKKALWDQVTAAFDQLCSRYDLVVMEGAGSPAELNLKARDIVNMAMAAYAQAPTLLVGDIDRGGVYAQLLGTIWLLEPAERELIKGLVVNKFRGDPTLFEDGIEILEEKGGVPVLGVVPFISDLGLPEEDAVALDAPSAAGDAAGQVDIAVIHLPRISNFDDFDPLAAEPGVHLRYVSDRHRLGKPDAIILPGSKSTIGDLQWLQSRGLDKAIRKRAAAGSAVVGICGGYQMLGRSISDPDGVESRLDELEGLALLPQGTVFQGDKETHQVQARLKHPAGWLASLYGQTITGYEIHMGRTTGGNNWLEIEHRSDHSVQVPDGGISDDGRVWGCYLHGLFENDALRRAWLRSLGWKPEQEPTGGWRANYEAAFERLADVVESTLDMEQIDRLIGLTDR